MNRRAYIITFDRSILDGINYTDFHKNLTTAKGIISWWHYLECTYIILVDKSITAKGVSDYIQTLMPKKMFFVVEIKIGNYHGYLKQEAWDWIEKVKKTAP